MGNLLIKYRLKIVKALALHPSSYSDAIEGDARPADTTDLNT